MAQSKNNLRDKFQRAHIKDDYLQDLVEVAEDFDVNDTLHLMLDSELLSDDGTEFYRLNKELEGQFGIGIEPRSERKVQLDQRSLAHTLILGKTQYGKSNLLLLLATQFLNRGVNFWTFEPKQDQRHLLKQFPDLKVIRLDEIKQNPLNPPVESFALRRWWQIVWELLTQEQELLSGSKAMGYELLEKLLGDNDHSSEEEAPSKNIPTLSDFLDLVEELLVTQETRHGPRRRYLERHKTRLKSQLFSFKSALDCRQGWPIEDLQNESIVFEYEGIDTSAVRFMVMVLLYKLFYFRRKRHSRLASDFHFLLFDEGEKIFSPYLEGKAVGNPFLNEIINWSKEFGLGFIVANQTPKVLSAIRDNASTRMVFNIDGGYLSDISPRLGLDSNQSKALLNLEVGAAVVNSPEIFEGPFQVKIPFIGIDKDVTDREVINHSDEFMNQMDGVVIPNEKSGNEKAENGKSDEELGEELEIASHMLLENIARFPYLSISSRKEKLGWSNSKLSDVRGKLRTQGYIRKKRLTKPEGGRGSSLTILEATGKARSYLQDKGIKTKYIGRGGAIHSYYLQWFLNNLKNRGVDVSYETKVGGISVDLFIVKKSGKTQVIEVEVSSTANTLGKLEKLLEMVDRVLIVSDKKVLVAEFKQEIEKMNLDQDRVRVRKIQEIEF